jgi:hypothetical protein
VPSNQFQVVRLRNTPTECPTPPPSGLRLNKNVNFNRRLRCFDQPNAAQRTIRWRPKDARRHPVWLCGSHRRMSPTHRHSNRPATQRHRHQANAAHGGLRPRSAHGPQGDMPEKGIHIEAPSDADKCRQCRLKSYCTQRDSYSAQTAPDAKNCDG